MDRTQRAYGSHRTSDVARTAEVLVPWRMEEPKGVRSRGGVLGAVFMMLEMNKQHLGIEYYTVIDSLAAQRII